MGYTHYLTHTKVDEEVWHKILSDCRKLYRSMPDRVDGDPLLLGNWQGTRQLEEPFGDLEQIAFNGYPEPWDHESFVLQRRGSGGFQFCKTARKPYDLMVCACLIVYCFHSRETMDLSSDGDWDDWEPAMRFVGNELGQEYVMKFKMEQKNF